MKTSHVRFAVLTSILLLARGGFAQLPGQPAATPSPPGYFVQYGDDSVGPTMPVVAVDCSGPDCQVVGAAMPVAAAVPPEIPQPVASWQDPGEVWTTASDAAACDVAVDESCSGACGGSCCGGCGVWSHFTSIYGGLRYMRPRNAGVSYAVPIDGPVDTAPVNSPIQIGPVGMVDPDYDAAFDVGANLAINAMTSIMVNLTMFDSTTSGQLATGPPAIIRSLVSHPSSTSAASDFLSSRAELGLQLDTVDLGLRHLFVGGDVFAVNYSVAARYARLEQEFSAVFVNNGTEQVNTNIDFDGAGLRLGLEAERHACRHPVWLYTRCSASFIAGKFQADYFQGQSYDPSVVDTQWEAGRLVPILDLELGGGWCSPGGRLHLTAGYVFSAWFNTVTTQEFISAVQQNNFLELGDTLTFDGLVARAELRF